MLHKVLWNSLLATPAVVGAALLVSSSAIAAEATVSTDADALLNDLATASEFKTTTVSGLTADVAPAQSVVSSQPQAAAPVQLAQMPVDQQPATTVPAAPVAPAPMAPAATPAPAAPGVDSLQQVIQYSNEGASQAQVTSISQLSDVQPTDWAFQALQSLVERYGCIAGYPDGTYRGNRAMTRYEFAAGLNACLDRISELIAQTTADLATKEDLATLQRLQEEFAAELATLRGRVDSLEARTAELEANQFSTTTKLRGETIFAISDVFGDEVGETNNTVFQQRVRLNFDTSFTGNDLLRARLQAGNGTGFVTTDAAGNTVLGSDARLGFTTDTSNNFQIEDLYYRFPVSDGVTATVFANGGEFDDSVNVISPFASGGQGAVSRFGRFSPIYRTNTTSAGAAVTFDLNDDIALQLAYLASEANNPVAGAGLFNGNYGGIAQLTFTPGDRLALGLTYANVYSGEGNGYNTGTGSTLARVNVSGAATSVNTYGIAANYKITNGFQIGGWAQFANVRAIGVGDAEVWSYAGTLAFPDLGGAGNLLGFVVGVQPYLGGSDTGVEVALGADRDEDRGVHIEGFYRLKVNDNISITPGVIWLTAPNHDSQNSDAVVGTIRTTFSF